MLPRLKISSIPRTGKPYKLDPIPPEIIYTIEGKEFKLKVARITAGNLERDLFVCETCGKTCTILYFKDSPQCKGCARPPKVKPSLETLYRDLNEAIAHNLKLEAQKYQRGNRKIKKIATQIARLENELAGKL